MRIRVIVSVMVVTVLSLCVMAAAAAAATYNVNVTTDTDASGTGACTSGGSPCSLREAINAVNAGSGGDTIVVPAGTYTINAASGFGKLQVNKSVSIQGAGASSAILDGGGATEIMDIGNGSVTVSGLTLRDGATTGTDRGGAMFIESGTTVTLSDDAFSGNTTQAAGGALEIAGNATIDRSTFTSNTAPDFYGGAINAEFANTVTIDQSTFMGNQASGTGAAIRSGASLTVTRSVFSGNTTMGDGGAIGDETTGGAQISDSTFTNNSAAGGGGAISNAHGTLTNDTLVGNSPDNLDAGPSVENTIIAGATPGPNCEAAVTSLGHNIEDANSCGLSGPGDQINTNPKVRVIAANGGPTQTMALQAGSPAIDAGSNSGCPSTDQRGVARPQGPACDIGAYELAPPSAATGPASGMSFTGATISASVRNPDAQAATVTFKYGKTTSYGSTVVESAPAFSGATTHRAALSSLQLNTTYHYTVVVTNPDGTSTGVDRTFTTAQIRGRKVSKKGTLRIKLGAPDAGVFKGKASFRAKHGRHKKTFTYGRGRKSASGAGTVTLTIKLSRQARRELLRLGHATVSVTITFTPTGGTSSHETIRLKIKVNRKGRFS